MVIIRPERLAQFAVPEKDLMCCCLAPMDHFAHRAVNDVYVGQNVLRVGARLIHRFVYISDYNLIPSSADLTREEIEIAIQGDTSHIADSIWTVMKGAMNGTIALRRTASGNTDKIVVQTARLIQCISFVMWAQNQPL